MEGTGIEEAFELAHVSLERPSTADVIDMPPDFPFVHLACHGISIHQDPARSGVARLKDNSESKAAVLMVSMLEPLDLEKAYLAYLSACSTA